MCSKDFHANGTITADGTCCSSDRRYKKDVEPIGGALSAIAQLKGIYYRWNREAFPDRRFSEQRQIGLIAQDVEQVVPEVVHTDDKGYKAVSYDKLTVLLIEAVKEQERRIEALEATIRDLSGPNNID
jgi:hypothetical protein